MDHLDHESLILLHYREELPAGAREHLLACDHCRRELDLLGRVLTAVGEGVETPELEPSWEEQTWNRLRWKLDRRPRRTAAWWSSLAAAAVLAIAFIAGRAIERHAQPPAAAPSEARVSSPAATVNAAARDRILLVVVADHLSRSERLFTEVKNAPAGTAPVLVTDRETIEDLVRKNRLYIDAANSSGQTSLADLLEEMQPLLTELARAPEHPTTEDIDTLQKRIDKRGAVLKLRLAGEQIRRSL